ncbi:hypothetical protein LA080_010963 [Diaporthe eres]|nr:hypothetical protein LA080_010963 [Diaporthe eres]
MHFPITSLVAVSAMAMALPINPIFTQDSSLAATSVPDAVPSNIQPTTSRQPTACCGAKCGNRLCGNRLNRCCRATASVPVAASNPTTATTPATFSTTTFGGFLMEFFNAV